MSTSETLALRLEELRDTELWELATLVPEPDPNRSIWVTRDILDIVDPVQDENRAANWTDYTHAQFRGSLDAFINWEEVSVSEDPFDKDRETFLARVSPVEWEFWDIRTIKPPPGMRCLGGFAGCDVFVALVYDYRENVGPGEFDELVDRCRTRWRELFGELAPYSGESLDAYLTRYIV